MKKTFALILSVVMCFTMAVGVFADGGGQSYFSEIWVELRNSGELIVNENGFLEVSDDNHLAKASGYGEFMHLLGVANESIARGILEADPESLEITNTFTMDSETVKMVRENLDANISNINGTYQIEPARAGNHGCSLPFADIFSVCVNNRNQLVNYYYDMVDLASQPMVMIDPYTATIGYLVGSVMDGGPWDYKRHPLYGPYDNTFCSYINGEFRHVTAEFLETLTTVILALSCLG